MEKETLIADIEARGMRLDTYLAGRLKGSSRSQIKRFIKEDRVLVDGKPQKPSYEIAGTERIEIVLPCATESKLIPEDIPLDILYEDDDIIILNKASGIVVHPAAGNEEHTLVNGLLFHTKGKLSHIDTSERPGIVHRLDKEVSGLMVVAKTDEADHSLVEAFKKRGVKRIYIAFVKGKVARNEGSTSLPIGRALRDRKKMAVRFFNSKEALTSFKVLKRFSGHTKLEVELGTGRTHQIRVHMSHMGHPIIGDIKYGGGDFKRIALYAAELILEHPCTGQRLHFKIDIPKELKELD